MLGHPHLWLRVFLPGPLFCKVGTDKGLGLDHNFVEVQNAPQAALDSSVRATHLLSPSCHCPTGKHPWTSHEQEHHPQEKATETHPEVYRWEEKAVSTCGPTSSSINSKNQIPAVTHFLARRKLSEAPTGKITCFLVWHQISHSVNMSNRRYPWETFHVLQNSNHDVKTFPSSWEADGIRGLWWSSVICVSKVFQGYGSRSE